MATEYVIQLPDLSFVAFVDIDRWEHTTTQDSLLARRFESATLAHCFAVMLVLPPTYTVEAVEQEQYTFPFHA